MTIRRFVTWLTTQESGGMPTEDEIAYQRQRTREAEMQLHDTMRRVGFEPTSEEAGYLLMVPVLARLLDRIEALEAKHPDEE